MEKMKFVDYERRNNRFLRRLDLDPELRKLVQVEAASGATEGFAVLVPQNVALEDVPITPAFARAHVIRFDPADQFAFTTLSGLRGFFSETLDSIVFPELTTAPGASGDGSTSSPNKAAAASGGGGESEATELGKKVHVLRHTEHLLSGSPTTLNIFVISDTVQVGQSVPRAGQRSSPGLAPISPPPPAGPRTASPSPPLSSAAAANSTSSSSSSTSSSTSRKGPSPVAGGGRDFSFSTGGNTSSGSSSASATRPFNFQDFVDKMRHRKAAGLMARLKVFLTAVLSSEDSAGEGSGSGAGAVALADRVRGFLEELGGELAGTPMWKGANETELDNAREGLEKYVMTKLHHLAFCAQVEDVEKDLRLRSLLGRLGGVLDEQNFDLPAGLCGHPSWPDGMAELRRMNTFKPPRDKVICIANCCRLLLRVLREVLGGGREPCADDFLPALILLTCRANPQHLHSNLRYICDYRGQRFLVSETGYYVTTMHSVVAFWENLKEEDMVTTLHLRPEQVVAVREAAAVESSAGLPSAMEDDARSTTSSLNTNTGSVISISPGMDAALPLLGSHERRGSEAADAQILPAGRTSPEGLGGESWILSSPVEVSAGTAHTLGNHTGGTEWSPCPEEKACSLNEGDGSGSEPLQHLHVPRKLSLSPSASAYADVFPLDGGTPSASLSEERQPLLGEEEGSRRSPERKSEKPAGVRRPILQPVEPSAVSVSSVEAVDAPPLVEKHPVPERPPPFGLAAELQGLLEAYHRDCYGSGLGENNTATPPAVDLQALRMGELPRLVGHYNRLLQLERDVLRLCKGHRTS
eukprot:RCo022866